MKFRGKGLKTRYKRIKDGTGKIQESSWKAIKLTSAKRKFRNLNQMVATYEQTKRQIQDDRVQTQSWNEVVSVLCNLGQSTDTTSKNVVAAFKAVLIKSL